MDKHALAAAVDAVHADWLALVDGLAIEDLDRPVGGGWRVRDVLAHANCWDR